jgi:hypothetical protein
MAGSSRADRLVRRGPKGSVEYAIRANGKMEAKEWLEAQSAQTQAAFDHMFRSTVEIGRITNRDQFKQLEGDVYEFKRRVGQRLFCFKLGNRWLLTHYKHKSKLKNYGPDIERAKNIGREHIAHESQEAKSENK